MLACRSTCLAALGLLLILRAAAATQPPPALPAPLPFSQPNPYDVWRAYAPDRYGHFRPLVALTPTGAIRVLDGTRFAFVPTDQLNVVPTITDSLGPVPLQPAGPGYSVAPFRRRFWRPLFAGLHGGQRR